MHQDTKSARLIAVFKRSYKYYIVYKICPPPEEQVLEVPLLSRLKDFEFEGYSISLNFPPKSTHQQQLLRDCY